MGKNTKNDDHAVKRRVRVDRIFAIIIPIILIAALITFLCLHSCDSIQNDPVDEIVDELITSEEVDTATATTTVDTATAVSTTNENEDTAEPATTEATTPATMHSITLTANDVHVGSLILVNADNIYPYTTEEINGLCSVYENCNGSYSVSDMEVMLQEEAIDALNNMMADYEEATGYSNMRVFGGYRDIETQDALYNSGESDLAGGYCDEGAGYTFNISINFGDGTSDYYNAEKYPTYEWIADHAAEYGFVVRYPKDKEEITGHDSRTYTYRYVGTPHAAYMTEHNLCLEEYIDMLTDHTDDEPLIIATDDGNVTVYYRRSDGGSSVNLDVTENYTVSGNNVSGYVVTLYPDDAQED